MRIALNPETDQELRHEGRTALARFEIWLVLGGLALIGAFKMLTGGINMAGLRDDKATGGPSPGSVWSPVLAVMSDAITREADDAVELPTTRARARQPGTGATDRQVRDRQRRLPYFRTSFA